MTEPAALPAVRERNQRLDDLARLGQWLSWAEADQPDERSRGASAALRLYYASELGLSAMAAAELSIIKGRLVVGAVLLRALARRAGYRVTRLTGDGQVCVARITDTRTGELLGEAEFTLEDAKRAGLVRAGSAWTTHPARMLWARASKNVIADFAPEVLLGMVLDDEVAEADRLPTGSQDAAPAASETSRAPSPPADEVDDADVVDADEVDDPDVVAALAAIERDDARDDDGEPSTPSGSDIPW